MDAWAKDQNVSDTNFLTMMGDPSGALTSALGMTLNHPGPMSKLGYERCKRFAMFLDDGVIKVFKISEKEDDPAIMNQLAGQLAKDDATLPAFKR